MRAAVRLATLVVISAMWGLAASWIVAQAMSPPVVRVMYPVGCVLADILPHGQASPWRTVEAMRAVSGPLEPLDTLGAAFHDPAHFSAVKPWSRMLDRQFRSLDSPEAFPLAGRQDPQQPGECRVIKPWTLDWFMWLAMMVFVALPVVVWTLLRARLALLFLLAVAASAAWERRLARKGVSAAASVLYVSVRAAALGWLPLLLIPASASLAYVVWWAFDYSEMPHSGPMIASLGPFALGMLHLGGFLLVMFGARLAAKRVLKYDQPRPPTSRWWAWSAMGGAFFCFTWPITSAWINLLIPGPQGRYWLPF